MSPRRRLAKRVTRTFLPIILVIVAAVLLVTVLIVYTITRPPQPPYLVTPQTFAKLTGPLKGTEVTWSNHDGTRARGWLVTGDEGAPAVLLLHHYGANRSWLLNLAIKLNETTHFSVLWPDLRAHGENPPVNWTMFGSIEGDDALAALEYLHSLKGSSGKPQVSDRIGIYGIELGGYAALEAARQLPESSALALDSVPASPDDLIAAVTSNRIGVNLSLVQRWAQWGVRIWALGKFQNTPSCDLARSTRGLRVLLLAGLEGDPWRNSTLNLAKCFSGSTEIRKDLSLTGVMLHDATGEQEEAYDRPIIEFFDKSLR